MAGRSIVPALRVMLVLVVLLALLQPALQARLLPPLVAVWFGLDGQPLVWAARGWLLAAAAAVPLLIGAVAFAVLHRLGRRPDGPALERLGLWLAIVSAAFCAVLAQLAFDANSATRVRLALDEAGWLGASYALFLAAWTWALRRRER